MEEASLITIVPQRLIILTRNTLITTTYERSRMNCGVSQIGTAF